METRLEAAVESAREMLVTWAGVEWEERTQDLFRWEDCLVLGTAELRWAKTKRGLGRW